MEVNKARTVVYVMGALLLVIGIVCYAAIPDDRTEEPVRIFYKSTAGAVLFDHKVHAGEDGYGFLCLDCHHDIEEEGETPSACIECHETDSDDESVLKRSDAFHVQCIECHEEDGTAPTACTDCHVM